MTIRNKDTEYEDMDVIVMYQYKLGLRTLEETIRYFESKDILCFCYEEFPY